MMERKIYIKNVLLSISRPGKSSTFSISSHFGLLYTPYIHSPQWTQNIFFLTYSSLTSALNAYRMDGFDLSLLIISPRFCWNQQKKNENLLRSRKKMSSNAFSIMFIACDCHLMLVCFCHFLLQFDVIFCFPLFWTRHIKVLITYKCITKDTLFSLFDCMLVHSCSIHGFFSVCSFGEENMPNMTFCSGECLDEQWYPNEQELGLCLITQRTSSSDSDFCGLGELQEILRTNVKTYMYLLLSLALQINCDSWLILCGICS